MLGLGSLASRLAEAEDLPSAAELLAEHLADHLPGAAARIYVLGPGDRCATCPRARDCEVRDRCLHLVASLGSFACPPGLVERIPRVDPGWEAALLPGAAPTSAAPPPALEAPPGEEPGVATLVPLVAGGEALGVAALRTPARPTPQAADGLSMAALLAATTFRMQIGRRTESTRYRHLLLVNELGRKVNAILNDELLLRQTAVDIHRTFGFHNVMVFMMEPDRTRVRLRAQAARYPNLLRAQSFLGLQEGIVGRALQHGSTQVVGDVRDDSDFVPWFQDTRAEIAVPIQIGGVVEGVLNVESDQVDAFTASDRLVLETVANQLAIAIENARLFGMVKEREDRYRALVESNPGAVLHLDTQGRIVLANAAVAEVTGHTKGEVEARQFLLTEIAVPEDVDRLEEAVREALRGIPRRDVEFQVEQSDGSRRYVVASLQPLRGEQGEARGVVVLARDRTPERELQSRLRQTEKLSAMGSLVSGVAHELNNPLAGILGFSQLLLARPQEQWARADIEKIEKNARRCQSIVENLLTFARQARLRRRPVNVNELIDSVIRLNEYQFRMDDVRIERDFDLRMPDLPLDTNRWQQVFINLLSNAHQALLDRDASQRTIRFETRVHEDEIEIRVADTGPGIRPELRDRIFEPFFTTKDNGTGLGLGICFGIVNEHGGTIELDARVREGAAFCIRIPVAPSDSRTPSVPVALQPARKAGLGRRVLVVDDEEHVREVVCEALARHDWVVDGAAEGRSALDLLAAHAYDVVLTDVTMPGDMDGLDVYDEILARRPALATRVVFLTGNILRDGLMDEIGARGGRCLEKPFDIEDLAKMVNDVAMAGGEAPAARGASREGSEAATGPA